MLMRVNLNSSIWCSFPWQYVCSCISKFFLCGELRSKTKQTTKTSHRDCESGILLPSFWSFSVTNAYRTVNIFFLRSFLFLLSFALYDHLLSRANKLGCLPGLAAAFVSFLWRRREQLEHRTWMLLLCWRGWTWVGEQRWIMQLWGC